MAQPNGVRYPLVGGAIAAPTINKSPPTMMMIFGFISDDPAFLILYPMNQSYFAQTQIHYNPLIRIAKQESGEFSQYAQNCEAPVRENEVLQ